MAECAEMAKLTCLSRTTVTFVKGWKLTMDFLLKMNKNEMK